MKTKIHPTYYSDAKIVCSCGAVFENVGSTVKELRTELCSQCHPFYTGRQKYVDTGGRIEKFEAKRKGASKTKAEKTAEVEGEAITDENIPKKEMPEIIEEKKIEKVAKAGKPVKKSTKAKEPAAKKPAKAIKAKKK